MVGDSAAEILASTSCSVELASIDDPSDSVTIRGPQAQLPLALTAAMEKANQQRVETVDLVSAHRGTADPLEHAKAVLRWLIRNGKLPRVQGVQVYTPRPAIIESTSTAVIEIVGADASEVGRVRDEIDGLVKRVPPSFVTIADIDPLLHRYLIGKKGQNCKPHPTIQHQ